MEVKLVVAAGKQAGKEIRVPGAEFLVGRSEDCHLRPQSNMVSRRHCAILLQEGAVVVRDFDSRNGTFVNGERVKGDRELKNGDRLKIGPLEFDVQVNMPVGGKKKPKVHTVQEAAARTVENKADEDLDISKWLEEEEDQQGGEEAAEPAGSAPVSGAAKQAEQAQPQTPEKGPEEEKPEEKPEEEKPVKIVGQFARATKPKAESSTAAAADMLRQLFERKPPGRP